MKVYLQVYLPNAHKSPPFTIIHDAQETQTMQQLLEEIPKVFKEVNPTYCRVFSNLNGKQLHNFECRYVQSLFEENSDIYLYFDLPRPVQVVEKVEDIKYKAIAKYTFYEYDENRVRVILELPGIGALDKSKIQSRFLDQQFEVKIHDFNKENLIFAVPKTQCKLNRELSKIMIKENKIIVSIRKLNSKDNWFSLYKQKTIGGDDD